MAERVAIGVDPGVAPSLGLVSSTRGWIDHADESRTSTLVTKTKRRPVGELIRAVIEEWRLLEEIDFVVIEKIGPWSGQGLVSTAEFVGSMRLVEGVAIGLGLRVIHLTPAAWKRQAGLLKADKDASRALAARLWPTRASALSRAKDHNRAEAALIAQAGLDLEHKET